jgi:pSer/pThr/pTyr-binding forkhead associated (FHA) protein
MNDDFFCVTLSACQCRGRVSRLEATVAQRRKVLLLIFIKNFNSYSYSATPIFEDCSVCIIGRNLDCNPQLPSDDFHTCVSRYHCLLDINPPYIRIRDFGSRNGTYVNNRKIGQREANQNPEDIKQEFPEYDLQDV